MKTLSAREALSREAEHISLIAMSHQELVEEVLRLRALIERHSKTTGFNPGCIHNE